MKLVRNILSIVLVIAFFNVVIGKSIHEIFEHNHKTEICVDKDINHFHKHEFAHIDFICDFNFSTSLLSKFSLNTETVVRYYEKQLTITYLWLVKNSCLDGLSLRGPPMIK